MKIVPFEPAHLTALRPRLNADQALAFAHSDESVAEAIASTCTVFTGIADDGQVMVVAGTMRVWEGRYHLFAYMSLDSGPYMTSITRGVRRFLSTLSGRCETQVSEGFDAGKRWVEMLGFKCETPNGMDAFFPGNRRGYMYSRVMP